VKKGSPIATYSDLELFMGLGTATIDQNRATLILGLAQDLCEAILTPLPTTAKTVVLSVAARGFSNPTGALTETTGPYTVQRGPVALTLYKSDRAHLRRLMPNRGGFSIETLSAGTSAVQLITISGSPTGGTFTLSFFNVTTAPIAYNTSASTIQNALSALQTIQSGNLVVTGAGPFTVTFQGNLATTPVPMIGGDGSGLLGGTTPAVAVTSITQGVYAPGQNLSPWDYDYPANYLNGEMASPLL
jgi:hypothetical protein